MFERIKNFIIKEFIQVFRDPKMRIVMFVIPVLQLLIFGFAVSTDVNNVRTAVYDLDNTPESRALVREFAFSKYFSMIYHIYTDKQERELIDRFKVQAVIRINRGFSRDVVAGRTAIFQFIVDGADSNAAGIILSYANNIVQKYSRELINERFPVPGGTKGKVPQIDLRMRAWYNENLISRNYFVPGLVALILLILTMLLTAMSIVKEKEVGTIEQLLVTPLRPEELIIAKLLPFAGIGLFDVLLIVFFAEVIFKIPIRGNILLLMGCSVLYLINTLGMGLFLSTISKTQQEALMTTFFIAFPAVLLSGFVFSIESMPIFVQYLTFLNPLRYFLVTVRGIFLKGVGIHILWPQMTALFFLGVAIFTMSVVFFRKSIG